MALGTRRKAILLVLFIPSVERDGETPINQDYWVDEALQLLGRIYGGATAYPRAKGIWRDSERGGALIKENPVVIHSYTQPEVIEAAENIAELGKFCRRMGREARQGEIGLIIDDEYLAITDFREG